MSNKASLSIRNFKCFKDIQIPINQITILAGGNGNGKSVVIQSLLMLRTSIEKCAKYDASTNDYKNLTKEDLIGVGIGLNDSYNLHLGNSECVVPRNSNDTVLDFSFSENNSNFQIKLDAISPNLFVTPISTTSTGKPTSLFLQSFYYLNAERLGPRIKQEVKYTDFPNVGYQGEFTAQLLGDTNFSYSYKVEEDRKHPANTSPRIEQQTNAWLSELMPGVTVNAKYDTETMSAQIVVDNHFTQGLSVITPNIGFGISYVLPILVTGLIAQKGSVMIVENPEAHLHPSAQSKIGEFLARIASTGVRVIVETHSDHVLNGVQIAVAKKDIEAEDITVNFFSQPKEKEEQPKLDTIEVNPKGELTMWPKGFFDQSQTDFAKLFNLRRSHE